MCSHMVCLFFENVHLKCYSTASTQSIRNQTRWSLTPCLCLFDFILSVAYVHCTKLESMKLWWRLLHVDLMLHLRTFFFFMKFIRSFLLYWSKPEKIIKLSESECFGSEKNVTKNEVWILSDFWDFHCHFKNFVKSQLILWAEHL